MTKAVDMMGLGFSWPQANNIGYNNIAITAAGTTTTDATICDAQNSVFIMTATGSDGIRMSASTPLLRPIIVANTSGSTGKIYPNVGGAVNGGSTDAAESCLSTTVHIWMRVSTNVWIAVLGA